MEVKIINLDHFGRGIGRVDNKVVFIPNTLIGEVVNIDIVHEKKNYLEGKVIKYLKQSDDRVQPICPYFVRCGGCDLSHMSYLMQCQFKEDKVKDIMHRTINSNINIKPIIPSDQSYNYRNKVTFHVKEKIGYYQVKSYEVILIDNCYIADDKINQLIPSLNTLQLDHIKQIIVKTNNNQIMVILYGEIDVEDTLIKLKNQVDTIIINSEIIYGNGQIIKTVGDLNFYLSKNSFFQINDYQIINLYNKVLDYCDFKGNEKVLDLYCGTGTIGIYLSRYCQTVLGIEVNEDAIKDANQNKKLNNINNISFMLGDIQYKIEEIDLKPDIVVVDPPRKGLELKVIESLVKIKPSKIIYVSCDPMTLARDLKILQEDYKINEITPIDMFPQTNHVECVVLMTKIKR
ncbi:MAG: 23S rRNA (uracil(1939)-C(5))-methyltransferase RlmD [Bacilli bacterium]|nr:23S rRNA (uracil(1939)-C(5))-methyltransferase RlmD [Bacilli bacterium]MDD4808946.1 23S rRNA (uracil(1939)-C(5))-methyltransferase RlmD [Bacilli bacterium]